MSIRKFILILIMFLFINSILGYIRDNYIGLYQQLAFKIFYKSVLIISLLVIMKNALIYHYLSLRNNFIFAPLVIILLVLSFYCVSIKSSDFGTQISFLKNLTFLVSCIVVGFFEELLFRVFVFQYLRNIWNKNRIIYPMIITSILFGISHLPNYFFNYLDIYSTLNQIFIAIVLGFFLQSLYVRTNNIILIGSLHALINYLGSYKTRLLEIKPNVENVTIGFNDFFDSFLIFLLVSIFIFIPLSLWLIRPVIKKSIRIK